jgi:predicted phosphate transport protein (TIGR00153 family)
LKDDSVEVASVPREGIIKRFFSYLFGRGSQDRFLKLLIEQTEWTVKGVDALLDYMSKQSKSHAKQVRAAEKEADEVRRILIDELNRTFVTSIDREDIFALSRAIDDVVDYADSTVEEMEMLEVQPNSYLQRMASLLRDAAHEIHLGVLRLEDHPNVAAEHAMRAKALENRVEGVYREAIADLFQWSKDVEHVVEMLKMREIYRHLSNAADRGDEAANIIADIVVKMM